MGARTACIICSRAPTECPCAERRLMGYPQNWTSTSSAITAWATPSSPARPSTASPSCPDCYPIQALLSPPRCAEAEGSPPPKEERESGLPENPQQNLGSEPKRAATERQLRYRLRVAQGAVEKVRQGQGARRGPKRQRELEERVAEYLGQLAEMGVDVTEPKESAGGGEA